MSFEAFIPREIRLNTTAILTFGFGFAAEKVEALGVSPYSGIQPFLVTSQVVIQAFSREGSSPEFECLCSFVGCLEVGDNASLLQSSLQAHTN